MYLQILKDAHIIHVCGVMNNKLNKKNMGTCVINGKIYPNIHGVVTINNNQILVDGKPLEDLHDINEKTINITIDGNVEALDVTNCSNITVSGDVKKIKTGHGDITIGGNVNGDVKTGHGDIECNNVEGDVSTGFGDIRCGDVKGRVSTHNGNVYHK